MLFQNKLIISTIAYKANPFTFDVKHGDPKTRSEN